MAQLVEALRFKSVGSELIPNVGIGICHPYNPSGHTTALGSTQPLTEMRTRDIYRGEKAVGV